MFYANWMSKLQPSNFVAKLNYILVSGLKVKQETLSLLQYHDIFNDHKFQSFLKKNFSTVPPNKLLMLLDVTFKKWKAKVSMQFRYVNHV